MSIYTNRFTSVCRILITRINFILFHQAESLLVNTLLRMSKSVIFSLSATCDSYVVTILQLTLCFSTFLLCYFISLSRSWRKTYSSAETTPDRIDFSICRAILSAYRAIIEKSVRLIHFYIVPVAYLWSSVTASFLGQTALFLPIKTSPHLDSCAEQYWWRNRISRCNRDHQSERHS